MVSQKSTTLVTGGTGYIGSYALVELDAVSFDLVVADNLANANGTSLACTEKIIGKPLPFYEVNTRDEDALDGAFSRHHIDRVIHFVDLKAVSKSVEKPLEYYESNISGTLAPLKIMRVYECTSIIFSPSVTAYGDPVFIPVTGECPKGIPTNPYGWTKWMIEQMPVDIAEIDPKRNVVLLRYFNPIDTHGSGLIGENPNGIPSNLVPYVAQVAVGRLEALQMFGNDYDTPDDTGVYDYIHVVDLTEGYAKAPEWMQGYNGSEVFNLGTGQGYLVLEILHALEGVYGHKLFHVIRPHRAGDITTCYSDLRKAAEIFGRKTGLGIERMRAGL